MRSNFHKATKERADQLGHISSKKLVCDSFERPLEIEIDFYLHSTCRIWNTWSILYAHLMLFQMLIFVF